MIIKRDYYLNRLISRRHNGMVKVITGIRRCGKSFLLFNLFKRYLEDSGVDQEHIIEMAFDDFRNRDYRKADMFYSYVTERLVDSKMHYVLLDEVQMLESFEDVLNGFLHIDNVDVYVTGSNAKFLSKDIITEFRGRGDQIHISPLSFIEFMSVFNGTREDALSQYLLYGGLPKVVLQDTESDRMRMLGDLLSETYMTDILSRNNIKNDAELAELFSLLASNIGGLTNPQKLSNTFRSVKGVSITPTTIKSYIDYFCDSFLVESAQRYDVKGKKYIATPMKYYFMDLGLRNAKLNFRQSEMTHLLENTVYNELRRRGYSVDVGVVVVNGKNAEGCSVRSQLEVDFVCNLGSSRIYIQVAYSMPEEDKVRQEINSLVRIDDSFRKYVITADRIISYQNSDGIIFMNIYDFLLNEDSIKW